MDRGNKVFNYTYSAARQEEVEEIRKKYLPEEKNGETDKLEQLRKLDKKVTDKAMIPSLCLGIMGTLVMGFGMSLIMTDFADVLGSGHGFIMGLISGILGMCGVISAYPVYSYIIKKERLKAAPEVLRLTEEIKEQ